jgi:hypothetical protein
VLRAVLVHIGRVEVVHIPARLAEFVTTARIVSRPTDFNSFCTHVDILTFLISKPALPIRALFAKRYLACFLCLAIHRIRHWISLVADVKIFTPPADVNRQMMPVVMIAGLVFDFIKRLLRIIKPAMRDLTAAFLKP